LKGRRGEAPLWKNMNAFSIEFSRRKEKKAVCTQITYAWTWAKLKLR